MAARWRKLRESEPCAGWNQHRCLHPHGVGWRRTALRSFSAAAGWFRRQLRTADFQWGMVAADYLCFSPRQPASHRLQHVVPVGPWRSLRIPIWDTYLWRDLLHQRSRGRTRQHWTASGAAECGSFGAIFGLAGALIASFYLGEFTLPK